MLFRLDEEEESIKTRVNQGDRCFLGWTKKKALKPREPSESVFDKMIWGA